MKIWIDKEGELGGLWSMLRRGGEIVSRREDAELVVEEPIILPRGFLESVSHSVGSGSPEWWVSRFWNGKGFLEQYALGLELRGMMDWGMGADLPVGWVVAYGVPQPSIQACFSNQNLIEFLEHLPFRGPVSLGMRGEEIVQLQTWLPAPGVYAVLEGCQGRVSDWLLEPWMLQEKWYTSLLLSRHPFPARERAEVGRLEGVTLGAEKHLWLWEGDLQGSTFFTPRTKIGFATAHSESFSDASWRVRSSLEVLHLKEKQFRTDLHISTKKILESLHGLGFWKFYSRHWFVEGRVPLNNLGISA